MPEWEKGRGSLIKAYGAEKTGMMMLRARRENAMRA
jgi:hypothetical protein